MGKPFNREGKENHIFLHLYDAFKKYDRSLSVREYSLDLLSFMLINDGEKTINAKYKKTYRYMFDPWDRDGYRNESFYDKSEDVIKAAKDIVRDQATYIAAYSESRLIRCLTENTDLGPKAINILDEWSKVYSDKKIDTKILRNYLSESKLKEFLLFYVLTIFDATSILNDNSNDKYISDIWALLTRNGSNMEHAYEYMKHCVVKYGQSATSGILEILSQAGYPNKINEECDVFTLLEASDIYYYHKLTWGKALPGNRDFEYAKEYSKAAFKKNSPQAAWNLGEAEWKHGDGSNTSDIKIVGESDPNLEGRMLNALVFYKFAAKKGLAEAYNSIGNMCASIKGEIENYQNFVNELFLFVNEIDPKCGKMLEKLNGNNLEGMNAGLMEFFYKNAAQKKSILGMSNYTNFLVNKMTSSDVRNIPFNILVEKKFPQEIAQIKYYLELLYKYRLPSALTDIATLKLHKHKLNSWIHKRHITINNHSLSEGSDYEFIFPYYKTNLSSKDDDLIKESPLELLSYAIDNKIPSIQSPWAYYYIAQLQYESLNYTKAADTMNIALSIIDRNECTPISAEQRKMFQDQAKNYNKMKEKIEAEAYTYDAFSSDGNMGLDLLTSNVVWSKQSSEISSIDKAFIGEHGLAFYWIRKMDILEPEKVSFSSTSIQDCNEAILNKYRGSWNSGYYDLSMVPEMIKDSWILDRLNHYDLSKKQLFYKGQKLGKAKIREYRSNMNIQGIKPDMLPLYAVINKNVSALDIPTSDILNDSADYEDDNIIQESVLRINEPVIVIHRSKDFKYVYVVHRDFIGWIEESSCSYFNSRIDWLEYQNQTNFLIVTRDNGIKELNNEILMGTKLYYDNTRTQANTYTVYLPDRGDNGMIDQTIITISNMNDIYEKYLPYTPMTILNLLFRELGAPFGWGGTNSKRDCSLFVRDIYSCFGIELPRNSKLLSGIPIISKNISHMSEDDKRDIIETLKIGDLLGIRGHLMIYVGKLDNDYYVISMLHSYVPEETTDNYSDSIVKTKRVMLSTLNLKRADGSTWLQDLRFVIRFI